MAWFNYILYRYLKQHAIGASGCSNFMSGPQNKSENKQFSACRSSASSCGNCNSNNKTIQRPISLTTVDTKIASKALAKQLQHILSNLINYNQSTYVKVRLIFDIFRSIDDVLEYTKQSGQSIME